MTQSQPIGQPNRPGQIRVIEHGDHAIRTDLTSEGEWSSAADGEMIAAYALSRLCNGAAPYSYAMHRDVRTMFYALCNGRRFTSWHVLHYEPLIDVELKDIGKVWVPLLDMVGCRSV